MDSRLSRNVQRVQVDYWGPSESVVALQNSNFSTGSLWGLLCSLGRGGLGLGPKHES